MKIPATRFTQLYQEAMEAQAAENYLLALSKFSALLEPGQNQANIWSRIGNVLIRLGKWQQAVDAFAFILTFEPDNGEAHHGLAMCYQHLGRPAEACASIALARQWLPESSLTALLYACIHATSDPDPEKTCALFRAWGERFADPLLAHTRPLANDLSVERPLRIGYVSGDMREHSIAFFMQPILAQHDPAAVIVNVFYTGVAQDATTARLKKLVPHWFNVARLNDDALFNLIRKQKIDVLIDLSGHTEGQRLMVFARRAAPVQVTWLGFMSTLGMQAIDYRLTDGAMDPPGNEAWYVEKLFRLTCMASYSPPAESPLVSEPPMLSGDAPLLVSLNHSRKISDEMLLLWGHILARRSDCRLLLHVNEHTVEEAIASMQPRLERLQLPLDRIFISPHVPLQEFMQRGQIADIALDTAPVSGGTTTLHALWMGLPVVALASDVAISSATANTLKGLSLGDWVAQDAEAYIEKVLDLMDHPETLKAHRASIRAIMQASVLMDYQTRCRELERAFRLMWFNYMLGEPRYLHADHDVAQAARVVHATLPSRINPRAEAPKNSIRASS